MSNRKELKVLMHNAAKDGWQITKSGHGYKWIAPSGALMYTSATPSDIRAIQKIRSMVRRLEAND